MFLIKFAKYFLTMNSNVMCSLFCLCLYLSSVAHLFVSATLQSKAYSGGRGPGSEGKKKARFAPPPQSKILVTPAISKKVHTGKAYSYASYLLKCKAIKLSVIC